MTDREKNSILDRYPNWKQRILDGFFMVYTDSGGKKLVEWTNTFLFRPNLKDLEIVTSAEFPGQKPEDVVLFSGLMSLSLTEGKNLPDKD